MKSLKRWFGKPGEKPEMIEEVPVMEIEEARSRGISKFELEPIYVKSMELHSLVDIQAISNELRDGNIMILDISSLMNQDPEELKRAIDQLKGVCQIIGGDVGRLTESKVIATPKFVKIQFKRIEA